MKTVIVSQHITDKTKISLATSEAKVSTATEGITKVGIRFKKLLHLIILL
jgi:hypothetical protein